MTEFKLGPRQEEWLTALESGKYNQTRNALEFNEKGHGPRYCCLGVACRIAMDQGLPVITKTIDLGPSFKTSFDGSYAKPPYTVRDFYALDLGSIDPLIYFNDTENLSFEEIATRIRETPTKFFTESR